MLCGKRGENMKFGKFLADCESENRTVRIVALGDSVTEGCFGLVDEDIHTAKDPEAAYHQILRRKLLGVFPELTLEIINAGIGGTRAEEGLLRLEKDVLVYQPDLVIVCFGLNDGGEGRNAYIPSLRGIFERLQQENIRVIFMTPNMMNTRLDDRIQPQSLRDYALVTMKRQNNGEMDEMMADAEDLCREMQIPLCNCYDKWKQLSACGVDTTALLANYINHPTREMHALFADSLFDCLLFDK